MIPQALIVRRYDPEQDRDSYAMIDSYRRISDLETSIKSCSVSRATKKDFEECV